jgi:Tfp pilus assembly protein FimT
VISATFTSRQTRESSAGFSVLELIIVLAIIVSIMATVWTQMLHAQNSLMRSNAAQQFANYVERARSDSIRRHATDTGQMAQVTILNDKFYSVTLDSNGDGKLDAPLVVSLADGQLTVGGPFPRTIMFDWLGRTVDAVDNPVHCAPITLTNQTGASAVKISDGGRPSVVSR